MAKSSRHHCLVSYMDFAFIYAFLLAIGGYSQQWISAQRIAPTETYIRQFSRVTSMTDLFIAFGMPYSSVNGFSNAGSVLIYERLEITWQQQAFITAPDPRGSNHYFATSVALLGTTLAVGCNPSSTPSNNKAYIFQLSASKNWVLKQYLTPTTPILHGGYGYNVALSEEFVIVSSINEPVNGKTAAGFIYVFTLDAEKDEWIYQTRLNRPEPNVNDFFGSSVTIDGRTVIGTAPSADIQGKVDAGAATIFEFVDDRWIIEANLTATPLSMNANFGTDCSLSGERAAVSAIYVTCNSKVDAGAVFIYTRQGISWTQTHFFCPSTVATYEEFGDTISLVGNTLSGTSRDKNHYCAVLNGDSWQVIDKLVGDSTLLSPSLAFRVRGEYSVNSNKGAANIEYDPDAYSQLPSRSSSMSQSSSQSNSPSNSVSNSLSRSISMSNTRSLSGSLSQSSSMSHSNSQSRSRSRSRSNSRSRSLSHSKSRSLSLSISLSKSKSLSQSHSMSSSGSKSRSSSLSHAFSKSYSQTKSSTLSRSSSASKSKSKSISGSRSKSRSKSRSRSMSRSRSQSRSRSKSRSQSKSRSRTRSRSDSKSRSKSRSRSRSRTRKVQRSPSPQPPSKTFKPTAAASPSAQEASVDEDNQAIIIIAATMSSFVFVASSLCFYFYRTRPFPLQRPPTNNFYIGIREHCDDSSGDAVQSYSFHENGLPSQSAEVAANPNAPVMNVFIVVNQNPTDLKMMS
eukprot:TRINITY_DN7957_c0_g1_i1.p1 TRINITY_DN7957_c0_g1~~TRINITY_DN7957_c0_g1_i1.p1  ORF type:complete len:737 (-),score=131.77 TRINITY_DN7957_c0_g1_i1:48-2258(-)